jgi:hypothetical protein
MELNEVIKYMSLCFFIEKNLQQCPEVWKHLQVVLLSVEH